jgi:hypothetical protein
MTIIIFLCKDISVSVSTGDSNMPALRLYESVGFRTVNKYHEYVKTEWRGLRPPLSTFSRSTVFGLNDLPEVGYEAVPHPVGVFDIPGQILLQ